MQLHIDQDQINQIAQALWGISHAFEYLATAVVVAAIIRSVMNK